MEPTTSSAPVAVNGYGVGAARGETCGDGAYRLTIKVVGEEGQVYEETVADEETDSHPLTIPG